MSANTEFFSVREDPSQDPNYAMTAEEMRAYTAAQRASSTGPKPVDQRGQRQVIPLGMKTSNIFTSADQRTFTPTPSLSPVLVTGLDGFEEHGTHVTTAVAALAGTMEVLTKVDEAYRTLCADTSRATGQKAIALSEAVGTKFDASYNAVGKAIETIQAQVKSYETELRKPLIDRGARDEEMRRTLLAMSKEQREKTIDAAVEANDDELLSAVLGAHPVKSGVDPMRHGMWLRKVNENRNPQLLKRIAFANKTLGVMQRAHPLMMGEFQRAMRITFEQINKFKGASDASDAALAKIMAGRAP